MENMEGLIKSVMENPEYKAQVERAVVAKIIESINYKMSDSIYKIVDEQFSTIFKAQVENQIEKSKEYIKATLTDVIANKIKEVADKIVFEPYSWDFEKLVKDGIKIKKEKE